MTILPLAERPEAATLLARAYIELGFAHPADRTEEAVRARLLKGLGPGLPATLVGYDGGVLVGTVTVSEQSIDARPDLGPWLSGLFVMPDYRGRGLGMVLIRAAEAAARARGINRLYAGTSTAASLFVRAGWVEADRLEYHGEPMVLFEWKAGG